MTRFKPGALAALATVAMLSAGLSLAQNGGRKAEATLDDAGAAAARPGANDPAKSTRAFLGLGVEPDKVAAARGAPVYAENCAACHGPDARGGIGPNLLYSSRVLDDDHGEKLTPFLKVGVPDKGMPGFAQLGDKTLNDVAEFLHLQVENYANRGTYQNTNDVMTGDVNKGRAYFAANCTQCHSVTGNLAGVAGRYRPLELQRAVIFPPRDDKPTRVLRAAVETPAGRFEGQVTRIDDFIIVLLDKDGVIRPFRRTPEVRIALSDPLQWHKEFAFRLKDNDMTDLVTYMGTIK